MTPVFSSATVSEHTYNFWTTKTAQYIAINDIKIIRDINDDNKSTQTNSKSTNKTKKAQNNK